MKPLILDYATERKREINPIYQYDFYEALNMIIMNGKKLPFINSTSIHVAMLTKTKVMQESDDDRYEMLDLQTKTLINRESDDESFGNN